MYPGNEIVLNLCISLAVYICHSLVPRPFPPPIFHHFQYEILAVGTNGLGTRLYMSLSLFYTFSSPYNSLTTECVLGPFQASCMSWWQL